MTKPFAPKQHGSKPMTQQYKSTMAFVGEVWNQNDNLTPEERYARLMAMADKARGV